LYPYVIAVATHNFLQADRFGAFMRFAGQIGALEVHLLEPCATGKLAGNKDAVLAPADKQLILKYQKEVAQDDGLPILSCFRYLESPQAFGCGAGTSHLTEAARSVPATSSLFHSAISLTSRFITFLTEWGAISVSQDRVVSARRFPDIYMVGNCP
jgi:hypothetical protein